MFRRGSGVRIGPLRDGRQMLKSAGTISLASQHHPQLNPRPPIPGLEPNSFKQFPPCTGKIPFPGQQSSPDFMTRCGAGIGLYRQFGLFLGVGWPVRIGKHARIANSHGLADDDVRSTRAHCGSAPMFLMSAEIALDTMDPYARPFRINSYQKH